MSQVTDYIITPTSITMATLAVELQEMFAAAASANRGATAPSNPFEGMFWWDSSTTPEVLKRYTVAAGWVSLVSVNITTGVMTLSGYVLSSLYNANTILAATTDDTPTALTIPEQTIVGRVTGGNIAALTVAQVQAMLGGSVLPWVLIKDQKTAGTNGGNASAGTWNWRVLNTITGISGYADWCTLASNSITLAVGTYFIEASAPGYVVGEHKIGLYNSTTSTWEIIGSSERSAGSYNTQTHSHLKGLLTVTDAAHVFRLYHYTTAAKSTTGLGVATDCGQVEVYSEMFIEKHS